MYEAAIYWVRPKICLQCKLMHAYLDISPILHSMGITSIACRKYRIAEPVYCCKPLQELFKISNRERSFLELSPWCSVRRGRALCFAWLCNSLCVLPLSLAIRTILKAESNMEAYTLSCSTMWNLVVPPLWDTTACHHRLFSMKVMELNRRPSALKAVAIPLILFLHVPTFTEELLCGCLR